MDEVKRRFKVMEYFSGKGGHALYKYTTLETIALQMRKVLELVAMASLVANKPLYAATYTNFAKHWNAKLLLRDLERVNPDFYPKPIRELPPLAPGENGRFEEVADGYLTKEHFILLYEKCGGLLHARNPFGAELRYGEFARSSPTWTAQIRNLLTCHSVQLVGDTNMYLVHMKEPGHDEVRAYVFKRIASIA
jgi:hypothetical protein